MNSGPEAPNQAQGHRQRLRERFERAGFDAFAPHEVLELLLTLCIPRRDVKEPARHLLARFGSLRGVLEASVEELRAVEGIGSVTPVALHIIRETAALYLQQGVERRETLNSTQRIREFLQLRFAGMKSERVELLHLDSGRRLLPRGVERLEQGTVDRVSFSARRMLESALKRGARFLILAHNHPGGARGFSRADVEQTQAAVLAAAALDVELSDHFLIVDDQVISMREEGLLRMTPVGGAERRSGAMKLFSPPMPQTGSIWDES